MSKSKLLKGDVVIVIAGSHKGQSGLITAISKDKQWVSIQGIENTKHKKPTSDDTEGGIIKVPAKIHISNVAFKDPKSKNATTKIGYKLNSDGSKTRFAKKSQQEIKK